MDNALIINGIESLLKLEHKCLCIMKVKFALKIDISKRLQHFSFQLKLCNPFFGSDVSTE